jgi:outer membrane protein TolC
VAAAAQRYRASRTRYGQVRWLEDLVRRYDAFAAELRTGATTPQVRPADAPWPPGDVDNLQSRIVDADVTIAEARFERDVLLALARFEAAFAEALYQAQTAAVLAEQVRLGKQVLASVDAGYRAGRTDYASLLQAQMRLDAWREDRTSALHRAGAARTELAALLDLDPGALADTPLAWGADVPVPNRDDVLEAARTQAPEVRMAAAQAARAALMEELVGRRILPDYAPGVWTTRDGQVPPAMPPFGYATVQPYLDEIRLGNEAAGDALEAARRGVPAAADAVWAELSDAVRQSALDAGPQHKRAKQAVQVAKEAYQTGRMPFSQLDQVLRTALQIRLDAERHSRNARAAQARLAAITGIRTPTPSPRRSTP